MLTIRLQLLYQWEKDNENQTEINGIETKKTVEKITETKR